MRSVPLFVHFALAGTAAAAQQTYTVTSLADAGAGTLREAIGSADADADVDTIHFDAGLAAGSLTLATELTITESLVIDGSGAPGLTLDGGWDGISGSAVGTRILSLPAGPGRVVRLRDLHLAGGNAGPGDDDGENGSADAKANGGLVFLGGGELHLERVALSYATAHDGGLVWQYAGNLYATDCSFVAGRARDDGGAVQQRGAGARFEAINCTFAHTVAGFAGGTSGSPTHEGSALHGDGTLALDQCTFAFSEGPGAVVYGRGQVLTSRTLFASNAVGAGHTYVDGSATHESFAGDPLGPQHHNYADDPTAGFVQVATDSIALGALDLPGASPASFPLDCRSTLRGVVASPSVVADVRGAARGAAGEPGAREIGKCPDVDGDGRIDALDADVDGDSIEDSLEIAAASMIVDDVHDVFGEVELAGRSHEVAGVSVAYAVSSEAGALSAMPKPDVLGGQGIEVNSDLDGAADRHVLEIAFGRPVYDLTFDVGDLDGASANRVETVVVELLEAAESIAIRSTDVTLGSNVERSGNVFSAKADLGTNGRLDYATRARVHVADRGVDELRLTFGAGATGHDPASTTYYLANLSFRRADTLDLDGDGLPHQRDCDADGDGLLDEFEALPTSGTSADPVDTDGDGLADFLDTDSDDDGEPDAIEGHDTNGDGTVDDDDVAHANTGLPIGADVDLDGVDDGYDVDLMAFGGFAPPTDEMPENDATTAELDYREADANVAGLVFHDTDGDGGFGPPDEPIPGATVELRRELAGGGFGPPTTLVTGDDGRYLFARGGLGNPAGHTDRMQVTVVPPGGFGPPTAFQAEAYDYRSDSDIDVETATTAPFSTSKPDPRAFVGAGFLSEPAAAPLPVTFLTVRAECDRVTWTVADERALEGYRVEELRAGAWVAVGGLVAPGAGNYELVVEESITEAYYRVVALDLDGTHEATDVVLLTPCGKTGQAGVRAVPNPVVAGEVVRLTLGRSTRPPTLTDVAGRKLVARVRAIQDGPQYSITTDGLSAGLYFVEAGGETLRLVVR